MHSTWVCPGHAGEIVSPGCLGTPRCPLGGAGGGGREREI